MAVYDWIVIGNGIAGAALSYELAQQGLKVLLLERERLPNNATRYSYGGVAFWSGTTELMRTLCQEGIAKHRGLADELELETQFRELDLVMPIMPDQDQVAISASYAKFAIPPQLIDPAEACELEPMLNPAAIVGALTVRHGHLLPEVAVQAYNQAFMRLGGTIRYETVRGLIFNPGSSVKRVMGVETITARYASQSVIVSVGGWSRALLKSAGFSISQCFTQAELLETDPIEPMLRSLVMPAQIQRFNLEKKAAAAEVDALWDTPGYEVAPPILDAGAIQLQDGRIRMGQISRALTDLEAPVDAAQSEAELRAGVGTLLPALKDLPATWHRCPVAFCRDSLPLVGLVPGAEGIQIFSGFSNPLAIVPPLAQRFARSVTGLSDDIIPQLAPSRLQQE